MPRRTNTSKQIVPATVRQIARQIKRMSDAEIYALSLSGDRATRRIASQICHQRAEAYALETDNA